MSTDNKLMPLGKLEMALNCFTVSSLVAVGLSVGYEIWSPIGCVEGCLIFWSKYRLRNSSVRCIIGARAGVNSGIGIGIDFNSNSNSGIGIGIASHGIGIGIGIARWNWLELKRNWRFHFNSTNNCCYFMSFLQSRITNIDCLLIEIMLPLEYSTS